MREQERFYKIEAYLSGELPEAERQDFERQVENDPALALEVEMHRLEHDAMNVLVEREIRGKMQAWAQEGQEVPKPKRYRWVWLVAALTGLLLFLWLIWDAGHRDAPPQPEMPSLEDTSSAGEPARPGSADPSAPTGTTPVPNLPGKTEEQPKGGEKDGRQDAPAVAEENPEKGEYIALVMELYDKPQMPSQQRGGGDGAWRQVRQAYKSGNTREAIRLLQDLSAQDLSVQQWLGHLNFQEQEFGKAAEAFEKIMQSGGQGLAEEVDFELSLCYLAQGGPDSTPFRELLRKMLTEDGHKSYERAKELQEALQGLE